MNTPSNNLAPTAQLYKAPPLPPAKPKKQRASTPTAFPTATQPPRPTVSLNASSGNYMPPTNYVNTVPSAAEQLYTNPAIPPLTQQARTTSGTILPPYTPPASTSARLTESMGFALQAAAESGDKAAAVRAAQAIWNAATPQQRQNLNPDVQYVLKNWSSPTAPPQAAAGLAITAANSGQNLYDVTSDPLNEGPPDDGKKTWMIVAVVAVVILLMVKE